MIGKYVIVYSAEYQSILVLALNLVALYLYVFVNLVAVMLVVFSNVSIGMDCNVCLLFFNHLI